MAIKLPDDAGGLTLENDQTPESIEMEKATMLQKLANLPSNLLDAFTGEGVPIEYPNIPEATEMVDQAPGIIEALMPNLKAFFAS